MKPDKVNIKTVVLKVRSHTLSQQRLCVPTYDITYEDVLDAHFTVRYKNRDTGLIEVQCIPRENVTAVVMESEEPPAPRKERGSIDKCKEVLKERMAAKTANS